MKKLHAVLFANENNEQMFVAPVFTDEELNVDEFAAQVALQEVSEGRPMPAKSGDVTDISNFYLYEEGTGVKLVTDEVIASIQDRDGCDLKLQAVPNDVPVDEVIAHLNSLYAKDEVGSSTVH